MLRLIDANLNRLSEGLRLLEDVARFMLNDAPLSQRLKALRHRLSEGDPALRKALLSARAAAADVAAFAAEDTHRTDLPAAVTASARRVEESLRVLEELSKLPDLPAVALDAEMFKQARFEVYEIERELSGKVMRRSKRIGGLYVIIDPQALGDRDELETCRQAIEGGAEGIQLRDKSRPKSEILESTQRLQELCSQRGVLFSVNDHLDVALACRADCLHLGQGDFPVPAARRLLPIDMLLGCSTNTVEEALQAEADGADYVSIGSMYQTSSKDDAIVTGIGRLRQVREAVPIPIVAIGGINADNAAEVIEAGANAIAVISAVLKSGDIEQAARRIAQRIKATREGECEA